VLKKDELGQELSDFLFLIGYFTLKMFIILFKSFSYKDMYKEQPEG